MIGGDEVHFMYLCAIGFVLGLIFFFKGFHRIKIIRLIENTPTSKIRSLAMGPCELYGVVVPIDTIKSPFSKKNCVVYKYEIKRMGEAFWVTEKKGIKCVPFYLKDKTGKILVNPDGANLNLSENSIHFYGWSSNLAENVKSFIEEEKIEISDFGEFEFIEGYISPDEAIYMMGTAMPNPENGKNSAIIAKGKNFFQISDKSENRMLEYMKTYQKYYLAGSLLSIVSLGLFIYMFVS